MRDLPVKHRLAGFAVKALTLVRDLPRLRYQENGPRQLYQALSIPVSKQSQGARGAH